MSLSKVYKNTASFMPEQILSRQDHLANSAWQQKDAEHYPESDQQQLFIPGLLMNKPATPVDQKSSTATQPKVEASALPAAQIPAENTTSVEPPDSEIDLKQVFDEGVQEGRRQADEDFGTSARTLYSACNQLARLHETILRNNLDEMHRLVLQISEKIIRHSVTEQGDTILATIEDAIRLAVKSEEFQIRINPSDLGIIQQKKNTIINEISGLSNISLKADSMIERGGCLLESSNCTVDATLSGQLQAIKEALQLTAGSHNATVQPEKPLQDLKRLDHEFCIPDHNPSKPH
jgi:flagellar assembly protein FliH